MFRLRSNLRDYFQLQKPASKRRGNTTREQLDYQLCEKRQLLAAQFPAYINGNLHLGAVSGAVPYDLNNTFKLESRPSSQKVIYLDFTGHASYNNEWGHSIAFPRYDRDGNPGSFSDSELFEIQRIYQNVAEDFLPFNVNVTTRNPGVDAITRTSSSDPTYGIRVVLTQPTNGFGDGIGGTARRNLFGDNRDSPVFVFGKNSNAAAIIASHETGHALGLSHDGHYGDPYHRGTGGATSWGPIMGAPYNMKVTQWSEGEYAGSTSRQDDIAIIQSRVGLRPDDTSASFSDARTLSRNGSQLSSWGIISTRHDLDTYKFTVGAGNVTLNIKPFGLDPNLDIQAELFDSDHNLIATSSPSSRLDATFDRFLPTGTYYVRIDGVGKPGFYPDYGSLGFYQISGQSVEAEPIVIGESGRLTELDHGWRKVNLNRTYQDPVVVAGALSTTGTEESTVRIRNVTHNSFEIRVEEWDYLDQLHIGESVSYMVLESGKHTLADGTTIIARNAHANSNFRRIGFGELFDDKPVVLTQVTTTNWAAAVTTRVRDVQRGGFDVTLQEQESHNRFRTNERIAFIAIDQGRTNSSNMAIEASRTGQAYSHAPRNIIFETDYQSTPLFFADIQSFHGANPSTVRYQALHSNATRIYIEEERSKDPEVTHHDESIGYLALRSGNIFAISSEQNSPAVNAPLPLAPELDNLFADTTIREPVSELFHNSNPATVAPLIGPLLPAERPLVLEDAHEHELDDHDDDDHDDHHHDDDHHDEEDHDHHDDDHDDHDDHDDGDHDHHDDHHLALPLPDGPFAPSQANDMLTMSLEELMEEVGIFA